MAAQAVLNSVGQPQIPPKELAPYQYYVQIAHSANTNIQNYAQTYGTDTGTIKPRDDWAQPSGQSREPFGPSAQTAAYYRHDYIKLKLGKPATRSCTKSFQLHVFHFNLTHFNQTINAMTEQTTAFIPPSVSFEKSYASTTYHSPVPSSIAEDLTVPCILGVDEAGRGPVIGK